MLRTKFFVLDKNDFVQENFHFVLNKNNFVRADGQGINCTKNVSLLFMKDQFYPSQVQISITQSLISCLCTTIVEKSQDRYVNGIFSLSFRDHYLEHHTTHGVY